jgi:hypothetical protein
VTGSSSRHDANGMTMNASPTFAPCSSDKAVLAASFGSTIAKGGRQNSLVVTDSSHPEQGEDF